MNPYDPHDEDEVRYTERDYTLPNREVAEFFDATLRAAIERYRATRIALSKVQEAEAGHFREWENEMKGE